MPGTQPYTVQFAVARHRPLLMIVGYALVLVTGKYPPFRLAA
jgi:hypothetical protein